MTCNSASTIYWVLQEYKSIVPPCSTWTYSPTSHILVFPTQLQHHRANAMPYVRVSVFGGGGVFLRVYTRLRHSWWGAEVQAHLCAHSWCSLVHVPAHKHDRLMPVDTDFLKELRVAVKPSRRGIHGNHTQKTKQSMHFYQVYLYISSLAHRPGRFQDEMHKCVVIIPQPCTYQG